MIIDVKTYKIFKETMMSNTYFVYRHYNKLTGLTFYIGSGNIDRAFQCKSKLRSRYYDRIMYEIGKENVGVLIYQKNIPTRKAADLIEKELIISESKGMYGDQLINIKYNSPENIKKIINEYNDSLFHYY